MRSPRCGSDRFIFIFYASTANNSQREELCFQVVCLSTDVRPLTISLVTIKIYYT